MQYSLIIALCASVIMRTGSAIGALVLTPHVPEKKQLIDPRIVLPPRPTDQSRFCDAVKPGVAVGKEFA